MSLHFSHLRTSFVFIHAMYSGAVVMVFNSAGSAVKSQYSTSDSMTLTHDRKGTIYPWNMQIDHAVPGGVCLERIAKRFCEWILSNVIHRICVIKCKADYDRLIVYDGNFLRLRQTEKHQEMFTGGGQYFETEVRWCERVRCLRSIQRENETCTCGEIYRLCSVCACSHNACGHVRVELRHERLRVDVLARCYLHRVAFQVVWVRSRFVRFVRAQRNDAFAWLYCLYTAGETELRHADLPMVARVQFKRTHHFCAIITHSGFSWWPCPERTLMTLHL